LKGLVKGINAAASQVQGNIHSICQPKYLYIRFFRVCIRKNMINRFFYTKRGQEDFSIGPKQLMHFLIVIGLLLILFAIIKLIGKTILK